MLMIFPAQSPQPSASSTRSGRRSALVTLARAASVLALAALTTCDNLDNFEVTVGGKGVVPAGNLVDELIAAVDFGSFESIDLSTDLKNQGVTKDDVDSVKIIAFKLRIEAPPGATFDFLTSVSFYAETAGQPKVRIARIDSVPPGATELTLTVEPDVELKPYVVAPKMRFSGDVSGKRPMQETTIAAEVVLDVDVTVPGC